MNLTCTITGVDGSTDLARLSELGQEYSFAEFGILLSRSRAGNDPRYPSLIEIHSMVDELRKRNPSVRLALHICGSAVDDFMRGAGWITSLADCFYRIQLNFSWPETPFSLDELESAIARFHGKVITQHNPANAEITTQILAANHQVLFDASGGEGIRADEWPDPIPGKFCGYAGGIGPRTIRKDLERAATATRGKSVWIDMEGQMRCNNLLDLTSCESVLFYVSRNWIPHALRFRMGS
jgi:Phosphoribosylanthranilate isomerase